MASSKGVAARSGFSVEFPGEDEGGCIEVGKHRSTVLLLIFSASTVKVLEPRVILLAAVAADFAIEPTFRGKVVLLMFLLRRSYVSSQMHRETTSATISAMASLTWLRASSSRAGVTVADATCAIVGLLDFSDSVLLASHSVDHAAWFFPQLAHLYSSLVLSQSRFLCGPVHKTHFCCLVQEEE